jgi:hypothetical protein
MIPMPLRFCRRSPNRNEKMSNERKPENSTGYGSYEHQDLQPSGIVYFLLSLVVVTVICMFGLKGLYAYLDHRERATQTPPNPLMKQAPGDTRHVAPGYPETAFPSPRLEEDERGQLNSILVGQEKKLYSYGWVDQSAGTVRIPIDRAMDLLAQRGLPVLPKETTNENPREKAETSNRRPNQARGAHGVVGDQ